MKHLDCRCAGCPPRPTGVRWGGGGAEYEKGIVGDYAMILPVRLNLNEDVLTVTDFVFVVSQPTVWCIVWSWTEERQDYVGGAVREREI